MISIYVGVAGVGLGMVMQVLILAVQNAVEYEDLGVATAAATLFRSVGGSLGTAILGALFAGRLAHLAGSHVNIGSMQTLALVQRAAYAAAVSAAMALLFTVAAAVAAVGFLLSWLLEERKLRESVAATGMSEAFAPPLPDDPHLQIERAIFLLAPRETQRRLIERIAERAGVELTAAACWLLGRLADDPHADVAELGRRFAIEPTRLEDGLRTLLARQLVTETPAGRELTPAGRETRERLFAARREQLSELLTNFRPEQHADLAQFITRIARHVGDDAPAH
jgi:DNA-binding MarR family transcriptional regulator